MAEFPVVLDHPDIEGTTVANTRSSLRVLQARGWRPAPLPPDRVDLDALKRAQLDDYAASVGVEDPDRLPNIQAVKDAIAAVTAPETDQTPDESPDEADQA